MCLGSSPNTRIESSFNAVNDKRVTYRMKQCWICNEDYDSLSEEHIIPRFFGGSISTRDFSCRKCNQELGTAEQNLNPLSVLMHHLETRTETPILPKSSFS